MSGSDDFLCELQERVSRKPLPDLPRWSSVCDKTVKVVVLLSWVSRGGGTNLALEVIDGIMRRGITVVPVVMQLKPGEQFPDRSWRCLAFEGDYRNPFAVTTAMWRLCRILREEQPGVVQSFMWNADVIGGLACAATGVRHLSYVLDRREWLTSPRMVHRARRVAAAVIFRLASTRFVAVSQAAADYFEKNLPLRSGRMRLARNAVDINRFRRRTEHCPNGGPLRIGSLSRLVPEKGIDQLLRAAVLLNRRRVPFEMVIAGDGPERPALIRLAAELGITGSVTFTGDVLSPEMFYEGIDVLAVPSIDSEGLPTTILEGMAMGIPVVATDVGGANEAVVDGVTGRLVAAGSPEALSEAFACAANGRGILRRMGTAGRMRIEQAFTTNTLIDVHMTAFSDLVQNHW
jgi:Glycosyltransferase